MESNPTLHFEVTNILTGINSMTIYYENTATGENLIKLMFYNNTQKVSKAIINYSK
jgi:hypothetical protein